jgi:hypothetical protein
MADEIERLQALLAGALEQKSTVRLSERNVVELVRAGSRASATRLEWGSP